MVKVRRPGHFRLILPLCVALMGCSETSKLPEGADYGAHPELAAPVSTPLPTINVAPAIGWQSGETPVAAEGLTVRAFAAGLDHPRWLYVLPNGDVLVAETNAPDRPQDESGLQGRVAGWMMQRAGAVTASANRITLLRDADGDGVAETRTVFLSGLNSPFGMALAAGHFYVANTDAVLEFPYTSGGTGISAPGRKIADLPGGSLNHHWTKNLLISPDGGNLYATVGSNSNIGENGIEREKNRAAILEIDISSGAQRVFASGLRNPVGLAWQPHSGALWTAVNERDMLGSDLVPDFMTSVKEGGFYGWPYSYYGQNIDERVTPQQPGLVASAIKPDYALGAHTASLGLAFYTANLFPARYSGGAFVGQHGSWNRKPPSGYKVIFIPFTDGRPAGRPQDVLTGFLNSQGEARGRPVGVAIDHAGALLVADDVGNMIWRVTPKRQ